MKKFNIVLVVIFLEIFSTHLCYAGFLDGLKKIFTKSQQTVSDENTIVSALKEAVSIGTDNAVKLVSVQDGYLGNEIIKINIPENFKMITNGLSKIGYQKQVDDFILSMNRAAEKAAPIAKSIFVDAIKEMSFDDAKKILNGADTAATEYFKTKTNKQLYDIFKPIVSTKVNEVGATRYYKDLTSKFALLPFMKTESLDLDHHVTNRALEGLFYMIGEEEKKIRTDPKARITDLLKKVFEK
ncbi:MAG: DUF4197 domain-containing protein [Candidatus Brocadiaceae bacterium]|nr:DUF4197 domain-containing protein [Candidatus Brocadiaceae bacterium]